MKKNVTFLLGAGCEGKGQLELPSGHSFKRDTIIVQNVAELVYTINIKKEPELKDRIIISHNSYGILYQTLIEYGIDKFTFSNEDKIKINAYLQLEDKDSVEKKIRNDFKQIYREQFYNVIKDASMDVDEVNDNVKYFLEHACFYSYVDSLFNYLRKPDRYPKEVNRILKLYYAAYLSVLLKIFNEKEYKVYKQIVNGNYTVSQAREMLVKLVKQSQRRCFNEKKNIDGIYYNTIRRYMRENENKEFNIITTNYTEFAKLFTGVDAEHISFLHGKLDLFESVSSKLVGDIASFSSGDFIFPFIFVQSGVKPIVNGLQIHEFEKAVNMIEDSDELVILGYGINSDDEHISNLLRQRLKDGRKIWCLLYNNTDEERKNVQKELQNEEGIIFESAKNFEKVLNLL